MPAGAAKLLQAMVSSGDVQAVRSLLEQPESIEIVVVNSGGGEAAKLTDRDILLTRCPHRLHVVEAQTLLPRSLSGH